MGVARPTHRPSNQEAMGEKCAFHFGWEGKPRECLGWGQGMEG